MMIRKHPILFASSLAASGAALYCQHDESVKREWGAMYDSYMRIFRLVGTVGLMTGDYAYQLYVKDKDFRALIDENRKKLRELQEEQERLHLKLFDIQKSKSPAKERDGIKSELLIDIRKNEDDIDVQGAIVADLTHQTKERYADIHVRNATRLRDMCANNKGLYIKLGQHLAMQDY
eukprot:gene15618-18384_t